MSEYYKKLKDPRWQRRRLEILEKAGFVCEYCGSSERTMHVHHKAYLKGRDPWDYSDFWLEALCEKCHSWLEDRLNAMNLMIRTCPVHKLVELEQVISILTLSATAIGNGDLPNDYKSPETPFDWSERKIEL